MSQFTILINKGIICIDYTYNFIINMTTTRYFSQKNGLLVYLEDSQLTRVQMAGSAAVYWETTIGSTLEGYRKADGIMVAHHGRSVATVFRFGDAPGMHSRMRVEEAWKIDDIVFNVAGLSEDCFLPPEEILKCV